MTLAVPHGSYAADPGPAASEGESDFANSGESLGIHRLQAVAAAQVPATPRFGSAIDEYAADDPQSTCDPTAKPGPVALRALLNETYDLNNTGNITRACDQGRTSEHKEGRALDYMLNKNNDRERDIANTVVDWMLETDGYGNRHAIARRLGIMYIIWDRKIWSSSRASEGWRDYGGENAHTDHIHFSFSWPGARKRTTWWTAAEPEPAPVFTQSSSRSYNTGKYDHNYERGVNDTLVHYWYEEGWHRAILPGSIVSDPVAYYAADHDHVYGRTANGDLQHWWFVRGEGWKTANLGGDITGNPTAFYANGYHHVFARTTNGDLYHWWFEPGEGWKTANLGGDITDSPTAYAGSNLAQHAYARTTNGDLYHWWFLPGEGWKTANLGGDITNSPTGYHAGNGTDHVYARTTNGDLYHWWWKSGDGWKTANLGGDITDSPTAYYADGFDHAYARTTNGDLYHWWYTPGEGWSTANLGGDITGSPSSYHARTSEQDHVYARTRSGNLYHWWFEPGDGWKTANLGGDL